MSVDCPTQIIEGQVATITLTFTSDGESSGEVYSYWVMFDPDFAPAVSTGDGVHLGKGSWNDGALVPEGPATWTVEISLLVEDDGIIEGPETLDLLVQTMYSLSLPGSSYEQAYAVTVLDALPVSGTDGNDMLAGDDGTDEFLGLGGDDLLRGLGGEDILDGGTGNDELDGGASSDILRGGQGDDRIEGGKGDDYLEGRGGRDQLVGGNGHDGLDAGTGNDVIKAGTGNDFAYADAGADQLHGNDGHDMLDGWSGRDVLHGDKGNDTLMGGDGNDKLHGGAGRDWIIGEKGSDWLSGGGSADRFDFSGGKDVIVDYEAHRDVIGLDLHVVPNWVQYWEDLVTLSRVEKGDLVFDFGHGNVLTIEGITNVQALQGDVGFF